jgi:hypothetical protein
MKKNWLAYLLFAYAIVISILLIKSGKVVLVESNDSHKQEIQKLVNYSVSQKQLIKSNNNKIDSLNLRIANIESGVNRIKKLQVDVVLKYNDRLQNLDNLTLDSLKQVALEP